MPFLRIRTSFKVLIFQIGVTAFTIGVSLSPHSFGQPSAPLEQAQTLIEQGRSEEARRLLSNLIKSNPETKEIRLAFARLLSKMEKWDQAIPHYKELVSKNPDDEALKKEYAWVLLQGESYESAISVYDRLLENDPGAIDLHIRKAMALYGAGKIHKAISEYKTVLKLDPGNIEAEIAVRQLEELVPNRYHLLTGVVLSLILMLVLTSLLVMAFIRKIPTTPEKQFRREEKYIHAVALIGLAVASYYIFWRATATMNWEAWWFSVPVLVAEIYGILVAYLFFFMVWNPTQRTPPPPPPGRSVDVFIATYNEDPHILRRTILGCLNMTYPHKTYVLDDGNRPEVKEMVQELGCEYIAREKNTNAKAGNLNNAFRQTSGEFVVTFDADHVPLPHFLDRVIGYFEDPKVAFVQTPQDFYNVDSFQHRLNPKRKRMWTEQSLFFHVIQPGKDRWNSAFYCGSCAILRRSALEEIGGFAEATITEDIHTSILLHAKKYKSVYHNESLAYGLAPETALPFQVQRLRWGQGAMQVLVRDNPIWIRGLTFPQRLSYLASMTTYFDGFQKLIFYLAPIVFFVTGILPIQAFDIVFLLHFVPYFIIFLLSFELMSRGRGSILVTEQYNMAKFATFMRSSLGLFRKKPLRFHITPKSGKKKIDWGLLYPQLAVGSLSALGIIIGTARFILKGDLEPLAYYGNLVWALLNSGLAFAVIRFSQHKFQQRGAYRFLSLLPCSYSPLAQPPQIGLIRDCHEDGASLFTSHSIPQGTPINLSMQVGNHTVEAEGVVITSLPESKENPTVYRNGIRFTRFSPGDQTYILKYSFELAVPKFMETYAKPNTIFQKLDNFLRHEQRRKPRWTLALPTVLEFKGENGNREILGVTQDISEDSLSVITTEELPLTASIQFSIGLSDQRLQGKGKTSRGETHPFGSFQIFNYVIQLRQVENFDLNQLRHIRTLLSMARRSPT